MLLLSAVSTAATRFGGYECNKWWSNLFSVQPKILRMAETNLNIPPLHEIRNSETYLNIHPLHEIRNSETYLNIRPLHEIRNSEIYLNICPCDKAAWFAGYENGWFGGGIVAKFINNFLEFSGQLLTQRIHLRIKYLNILKKEKYYIKRLCLILSDPRLFACMSDSQRYPFILNLNSTMRKIYIVSTARTPLLFIMFTL